MTVFVTPRIARPKAPWTSAWYNGEVRDNLEMLHDLKLSAGSVFPTGPEVGQRHVWVSGTRRLLFFYDGTHWLSDELQIALVPSPSLGAFPGPLPIFSGDGAALNAAGYVRPIISVDEYLAAGLTLQARVSGSITADQPKTITVGVTLGTVVTGGDPGTETLYPATGVVGAGWRAGGWADTLTGGAFQAVQVGVWGGWLPDGGSPTISLDKANVYLRLKK